MPSRRENIYTDPPQVITVEPTFKLIKDPISYEMEFKKRNVWTFIDMKTFIVALLKGPKRFEKIGEALPHKTSKEIVFFYQT